MIYSGSLGNRLINPLNHDPVASRHHIDLNLVPALIDPQPSDTPDYHVFLLFNREPLTQHFHVIPSLDCSRDNSAKRVEVPGLLIVQQFQDVDAQGALRVTLAKKGGVGKVV